MSRSTPTDTRQAALVLVGCVKRKGTVAAPAQDLYLSGLFRKRAAFARKFGREWFILSALHGLVHPETVLEPYDVALNGQGKKARQVWAEGVEQALLPHLRPGDQVVLLGGAKYGDLLIPLLEQRGHTVVNPLARMAGLGPQQNWLQSAVESGQWTL